MDSNINNNMESNLSRADKEKFKNMISKIRENILEFKEYFFITILNELVKEDIVKRRVRTCYNAPKS